MSGIFAPPPAAPQPAAVPASGRFADAVEDVALKRDRAAFALVFDYYAPRLKTYLIASHCPAAQAEEIVQDTMVVLWQKADLFDRRKSSVATWLFRIARNRRIDLLRRDRSGKLDPEDPSLFPASLAIDETGLDQEERDRRVRAAIAGLPEEQRLLIRLSFFEGKPHGEIAEQLNLPLGTVKSRIRLAFTRLRRLFEADPKLDRQ